MSFQKKQVEDELPTEQIRNGKLSGVRIWHQAQSVMMCDCRLTGGAEVVVGHSNSFFKPKIEPVGPKRTFKSLVYFQVRAAPALLRP